MTKNQMWLCGKKWRRNHYSLEWSNLARKLVHGKMCFCVTVLLSVFLLSVPSFTHLLSFVSLFNDENKSKDVSKGKGCVSVLGVDWFWLISECYISVRCHISECYMAQIPWLTANWPMEHLHRDTITDHFEEKRQQTHSLALIRCLDFFKIYADTHGKDLNRISSNYIFISWH